jgi:hypothetical protein
MAPEQESNPAGEKESTAPGGFPEPPGEDPGDHSHDRDPHHALNNPADAADPTEWPDPYDKRPDPRDPEDPDVDVLSEAPHTPTGAESTSEPNPKQDPEAQPWARPPRRDNLDE